MTDIDHLECEIGECQCGLMALPEMLKDALDNNSLPAMRADVEFILGRLKCRYAGQSSGGLDDDITPCEEPEKCDGLPPCIGWKRRPITSKKYQHGAGGPEPASKVPPGAEVTEQRRPRPSGTEIQQQRESRPAPQQSRCSTCGQVYGPTGEEIDVDVLLEPAPQQPDIDSPDWNAQWRTMDPPRQPPRICYHTGGCCPSCDDCPYALSPGEKAAQPAPQQPACPTCGKPMQPGIATWFCPEHPPQQQPHEGGE